MSVYSDESGISKYTVVGGDAYAADETPVRPTIVSKDALFATRYIVSSPQNLMIV
jgi:hypothetical protein